MTHQQARRRFTAVLALSMAVFLLSSLALAWADNALELPAFMPWLLVMVPIVAFLTPLWAQWRYLNELDEYLRSLEMRAIFVGLAAILVLASSWGYAELYIDGPRLQMYWLNPVYWIVYSIASTMLNYREGQKACKID